MGEGASESSYGHDLGVSLSVHSSWTKDVSVGSKIHLAQPPRVPGALLDCPSSISRINTPNKALAWAILGDFVILWSSSTGLHAVFGLFPGFYETLKFGAPSIVPEGSFPFCGASLETHHNTVVMRPQPLQIPWLLIALTLKLEVCPFPSNCRA